MNYLPFWKIQTQFWRCDTAVSFILDMIFISLVRIQSSLLYKLTTQNNNNQNVSFVHLLFSICLNYKTLLFIILEKISRICLSFSISSFFLPFFFSFLKIIYQNSTMNLGPNPEVIFIIGFHQNNNWLKFNLCLILMEAAIFSEILSF